MKELKEIKLEDLSPRQKLGMSMISLITKKDPAKVEYVLEMIRNHSLGAVWVNHMTPGRAELIQQIKDAADYPILIMTDAEGGLGGYRIGRHNTLGCANSEELAYAFGKVMAVTARNMGYNVICDPVLDMTTQNCVCGSVVRAIGGDKQRVAELAVAECRGMHDGGILTLAKHYPGFAGTEGYIDSHMAESTSEMTKEELIEENLYPYRALIKEGLLDGIMTKHARFVNIDPDYPASLSQKMINIIRELGFDGISITDALTMMGVVAKFGRENSIGLAVANGNDMALPYYGNPKFEYEALCECYDKGMISDERLDDAVTRVLAAQRKTMAQPKFTELTQEDYDTFDRLNRESTYAYLDEGVSATLDRNANHLFVVLAESAFDINSRDKVIVDTMNKDWYHPSEIAERIKSHFPNSEVIALPIFPTSMEIHDFLNQTILHDDVVFITFFNSAAYVGRECLTSRVISTMDALQVTKQISTLVHFGNPFILEDLPHIPRILVGTISTANTLYTIDMLAGELPVKGKAPYDIKLK